MSMAHLTMGLSMEPMFGAFLSVATLGFVLYSLLELR
jgi:hypothetical protein